MCFVILASAKQLKALFPTCLLALDHAESVGAALSEDGQLGLLEELLEDATSSSEVLLSTLRCVAAVARSSSLARNLLDTQCKLDG